MSEKLNKRIRRTAQRMVNEKEPELIKQAVGKLATFTLLKRLKFAALIIIGERQ
jgi:hypothetical protein